MSFKLTYATMFNPPESMHAAFDSALNQVRAGLGARHALFLDGQDTPRQACQRLVSPIDTSWVLGEFALADATDVDRAVRSAHAAWPGWRARTAADRAALLRRVADLMESRVYAIAAALALEVGKNRMEALGEAQETVDFFRHYADDFERAGGFDVPLPNDPLSTSEGPLPSSSTPAGGGSGVSPALGARVGVVSTNRSVLRPYGVWAVIAPFNYPLALMGGPTAAALVTGNVVVAKGSPHTPWAGRLLADVLRDAGLPPGVFQLVHGANDAVGRALAEHPLVAGITFTGSVAVGRRLLAQCVAGPYPKPCIAEMGGKNPCIVTGRADLDAAAAGIVRSAYGLTGQKCSALSRLYVDERVADALVERLKARIAEIAIGDPTERSVWMGPLNNAASFERYRGLAHDLAATTLHAPPTVGGGGALGRGHFVGPVLAEAAREHPLWRTELFAPILLMGRVASRDEAMALANASDVGLSAGFYGAADEVDWFHEHIEAGVTYANRAQGATTGAWPGYQPFGGWKGSGSTGKAIASFYYLPLYLREQSRTVVR